MNSVNLTLRDFYTLHKKMRDTHSVFHFLNRKYKIACHSTIMRHFLDAGIIILETGKPLILVDIFGGNKSGQSYNLFYKFVEQGYFIKLRKGFILTDKGKMIMMEYMSLLREVEKKYHHIQ